MSRFDLSAADNREQLPARQHSQPGVWLVIALAMWLPRSALATAFTDNFNSDVGTVTSFSSTLGGVSFTYTYTSQGDGGDFAWQAVGGQGGSSSIDALSSSSTGATERITIKRTDNGDFTFTSIYINNTGGQTVTVRGYRDGSQVGSSQSPASGGAGTLDFAGIGVDEVRVESGDFSTTAFDSFTGNTDPPPDSGYRSGFVR